MTEKTEKEVEVEEAKKEALKNDEQLKNIAEDLKLYGDAEVFSKSTGGQKIIKSLEIDVLDATLLLTAKYKTASHIELISYCAALETKMDLLRRMTQAGKKKEEAIENFNNRMREILGE